MSSIKITNPAQLKFVPEDLRDHMKDLNISLTSDISMQWFGEPNAGARLFADIHSLILENSGYLVSKHSLRLAALGRGRETYEALEDFIEGLEWDTVIIPKAACTYEA